MAVTPDGRAQDADALPLRFTVGDVVRLKSGGPDMTVTALFPMRKEYGCTWFADHKLENTRFPEAALNRAEDGKTASEQAAEEMRIIQ